MTPVTPEAPVVGDVTFNKAVEEEDVNVWTRLLEKPWKRWKPVGRFTGTCQGSFIYLEAEEPDSVDDVVLPVGSGGRQDRQEVVDPQREEKQEAQKVAPDVHRLIGQDENAGGGGEKQTSATLRRA